MKERIIEFLKAENKSSAQMAEEIGVQPSGISHILSGRNNPSLDFILKMLEKYNFLSTEWLLFGKGNMYRDPGMQSLFLESNAEIHEIKPGIPTKTDNEQDKQVSEVIDPASGQNTSRVEKIVWFFSNNTFREYFPPG